MDCWPGDAGRGPLRREIVVESLDSERLESYAVGGPAVPEYTLVMEST